MKKIIVMASAFLIMCLSGCSGAEMKNNTSMKAKSSLKHEQIVSDNSIGASETEKYVRTFSKELIKIKEGYTSPVKNGVKTERITYQHKDHTKNAIVYLPPDYDKTQKHNILYILGGVSADERAFFGQAGNNSEFKNILDNMISNGDIKPCIVVNLAFYPSKDIHFGDVELSILLDDFNEELRYVIIPLVESKYSTYAENTSPEGITDSRRHRGFSGFSMGGAVAWNTIAQNTDYFSVCIPMAAGSFEDYDNNDYKSSVAEKLKNSMVTMELSKKDFFIFACEGTEDTTYEKMEQLIARFKNSYRDLFEFTDDNISEGNITYKVKQGAKHEYSNAYEYFYNAMLAVDTGSFF